MAVTVTCTPGGVSDNSYVSASGATAYFANTLRAATWGAWVADDRAMALIGGTQTIEARGGLRGTQSPRRIRFPGAPYADTQALHFPRTTDTNAAGAITVPADIAAAVCEQAYWLLDRRDNPPLLDRAALQDEGVSNVSVDGMSESYNVMTAFRSPGPADLAPRAWDHLRGYVATMWPTAV